MASRVTLGIDVGGTKIAGGVVDEEGRIVSRAQLPTKADDPPAVVGAIVKLTQELHASAPGAGAVGIGAAALVDYARGVVLTAPNLAWRDVHLRAMVAERTGLPAALDNDANVAALAEALHGAGRGVADQVMLTIGTGVGGGIVIGGDVFRGAHGVGAELGHLVVQGRGGPPCACGNDGCLEALASGNAIGRLARERASEPGAAGVLLRAGGSAAAITGEIVGDAAIAGDAFARAILEEAGGWLGVGMATIVNALDPALIVVGGGASATGDLLLDPARERMRSLVVGRDFRPVPPVVRAALEADAGIVGAAALARRLL